MVKFRTFGEDVLLDYPCGPQMQSQAPHQGKAEEDLTAEGK